MKKNKFNQIYEQVIKQSHYPNQLFGEFKQDLLNSIDKQFNFQFIQIFHRLDKIDTRLNKLENRLNNLILKNHLQE